jgi:nitrite reductase/ring-hydroxylating ferredoxin subunit
MTTKTKINALRMGITTMVVAGILAMASCEPDLRDAEIPPGQFADLYINLSLPKYQPIRTDGGSMYEDGGVRGLIIYRVSASQYIAYERNCSFTPNEACATVDIHTSRIYMEDPCCGSSFSFSNGQPLGGAAWRPLRRYYTTVNSSQLTITSQVIE